MNNIINDLKEMEDGQMLMRKDFGLFESMSATEVTFV
jgi:hypothetical protein